jgi:hypothetical protein
MTNKRITQITLSLKRLKMKNTHSDRIEILIELQRIKLYL